MRQELEYSPKMQQLTGTDIYHCKKDQPTANFRRNVRQTILFQTYFLVWKPRKVCYRISKAELVPSAQT